jgi:uncharacterized protein YuzE
MMQMHSLVVKSTRPPVVELDAEAGAVYVRFRRSKIARTFDRSTRALTLTVDVDAQGEVVGVEALGCREIVISQLLAKAHVRAPDSALRNARIRTTPALVEA